MIINIRGTSGSGKSHLVRRVRDLYPGLVGRLRRPPTASGRPAKQPLGYFHHRATVTGKGLFIPGHYETACGGCDTISGLDEIYALVRDAHEQGYDVLFEGLIVCSDARRLIELSQEVDVAVIFLSTPIEACISSVQSRRDARGEVRPLNPTNTEAKFVTNERVRERFEEAGVRHYHTDREDAYRVIRELLHV